MDGAADHRNELDDAVAVVEDEDRAGRVQDFLMGSGSGGDDDETMETEPFAAVQGQRGADGVTWRAYAGGAGGAGGAVQADGQNE